MHIAQLLFSHAGQAERELQTPPLDLGESIGSLATPFDAVFLGEQKPKGGVELPLAVAVEPDAEPMMEPEASEELIDVGEVTHLEFAELSQGTPNRADDVQGKKLEIAEPAPRLIVASAHGDFTSPEQVPSSETITPRSAAVRSESDHGPLWYRQDALPAWPAPQADKPEATDAALWKHAETGMPAAAAEAPASKLLEPVNQAREATGGQQLAIHVVSPPSELPLPLEAGVTHEMLPVRAQVLAGSNLIADGASASAVQVFDNEAVFERSGQVFERPTEAEWSSQSKTASTPRLSELQNVGVHAPTSVVSQVRQQNNPRSQNEEIAPDIPAHKSAPDLGTKTMPAPETVRQTPLPWVATPVAYSVEQEAERPILDDFGFRVVEQVSSTSGDLKPQAHMRGAEVPRMILVQIAEVVRQQPDRPVELTLSPEELGRLRMSFQSEGASMHIVLSFERPDTLDLMRRHIDQLAQDMREFGMSDVSFTFQQQTSEGGGGTYSDDRSSNPSHDPQSDPQGMLDDPVSRVLNIAGRAGVDIRV